MRVSLDVDALRREMARRGLTGAELAAIAGVAPATISHALNAHRLDHDTIRKLGRALTVTPVVPGIDSIIPTRTETAASSTFATVPSEAQRGVGAESPVPA
jgi:transcriptional regulator with XRE-family HTH domain